MEPTANGLGRNVMWRAVAPVSPSRQTTRFTFELAGYVPPATACGILVLLLYNQSAGIGSPAAGARRLFDRLAVHVASKRQGGTGLAGLARAVAAAHVDLGGTIAEGFIGKLVDEMALSVQRVFECVDASEIGLGILRPPPRRKASATTTSFALASCQYPGGLLDRTPPATPRDSPRRSKRCVLPALAGRA